MKFMSIVWISSIYMHLCICIMYLCSTPLYCVVTPCILNDTRLFPEVPKQFNKERISLIMHRDGVRVYK